MIVKIIIMLVAIWILFTVIIPILIMPNIYFIKLRRRKTKEIEKISRKLKDKSKEKTLKNVYDYITQNYTGIEERYKLANYFKLFQYNVDWNLKHKKQFLACHLQNWMTITLLLNTGQFTRKEIKKHIYVTRYLTIHQYLIVKIDKQKFKIDPFFKEFNKLKYSESH
ncbi:MAG: hypothetical protein KKF50_03405 [Nanoarchaeota archaeon]|nr:hypothetical protein [Nanoarchaeota archaeon]